MKNMLGNYPRTRGHVCADISRDGELEVMLAGGFYYRHPQTDLIYDQIDIFNYRKNTWRLSG